MQRHESGRILPYLHLPRASGQVFDTRCFHKFGESSVFRERTQHSATFESLQQRGLSTDPSVYANAESAIPVLELSSGERMVNKPCERVQYLK